MKRAIRLAARACCSMEVACVLVAEEVEVEPWIELSSDVSLRLSVVEEWTMERGRHRHEREYLPFGRAFGGMIGGWVKTKTCC